MVSTLILVTVDAGQDRAVIESIRTSIYYESVIDRACLTYGLYDLLIEANFKDENALEDFVFNT